MRPGPNSTDAGKQEGNLADSLFADHAHRPVMNGGNEMSAHFDQEDRRRQNGGDDEAEAQHAHFLLASRSFAIGAA